MNLVEELRNEAAGSYGERSESHHRRFHVAAADEIERLQQRNERLIDDLAAAVNDFADLRERIIAWADCQETFLYNTRVRALMEAIGR